MKKLESKVNIIPVIAKADTITKAELQKFKAKIMSELTSNGVQIYNFPTDDESVAETNKTMNVGYLPSLYQSYLSFILALTSTSVNVLSAVYRAFKPRLAQTKDYNIDIYCFLGKEAILRRKSKDWFRSNQDNVFKWSDMSYL